MANPVRIFSRGFDGVETDVPTPATQTGDVFPAGVVIQQVDARIPTGWMICDGSALQRSEYPALFAAIGTTYGAGLGDGFTFSLPDTRGKVVVGKHSSGTFVTLGGTGGSETHQLVTAGLPAHDHGGASGATAPTGSTDTVGNHTHAGDRACGVNGTSGTVTNVQAGTAGGWQVMQTPNFGAGGGHNHSVSVNSHNHSIPSQGSDTAHNNVQPYIALNHLIKAH